MSVREGFSYNQSSDSSLRDRIFSRGPLPKIKNFFKKGFIQVTTVLAFLAAAVGVANATSGAPAATVSGGGVTLEAVNGNTSVSASVNSDSNAGGSSSEGSTTNDNKVKVMINGQEIDASGGNVHKVIKDGNSQTTVDVKVDSSSNSGSSNSVNISSHSSTVVNGQEVDSQ